MDDDRRRVRREATDSVARGLTRRLGEHAAALRRGTSVEDALRMLQRVSAWRREARHASPEALCTLAGAEATLLRRILDPPRAATSRRAGRG